ncbi:transcriptional regulator [Streptomyces sp. PH10-H1]|uniref:transcriptional regulator n=1 Tax=Streptomyces sp. PH10-H1 TaxID=3046212 RepID=UPI0024B88B49|nr:transcriptional regulator [Streptomyces sp. PH10-H1]MDJ0347244.1 transcriptional regulator [Streptomyces sp. PH10-H1]
MPGRVRDFSKYGAQGLKSSEAIAVQLDILAGGIASPVESDRGLAARLRYLTGSAGGYEALERAGISVSARTLLGWLAETQNPNRLNLERIDVAYWDYRRRNVAQDLKRRLNAGGGTRVELSPVNQSGVTPARQRDITHRSLNVRDWSEIVDCWAEDDMDGLEDEWCDWLMDIGTDWGEYHYVSAVGFSA